MAILVPLEKVTIGIAYSFGQKRYQFLRRLRSLRRSNAFSGCSVVLGLVVDLESESSSMKTRVSTVFFKAASRRDGYRKNYIVHQV